MPPPSVIVNAVSKSTFYESIETFGTALSLKNKNYRIKKSEILNENIEQLGCSSCRNVFKLDALEHWLNIHYRCPYCNSSDEFYLI